MVHLFHRHVTDTVFIVEEGTPPPPTVTPFDILSQWAALNGLRTTTGQCTNGAEQTWRRLAMEEMRDSTTRDFQAYCQHLQDVTLQD